MASSFVPSTPSLEGVISRESSLSSPSMASMDQLSTRDTISADHAPLFSVGLLPLPRSLSPLLKTLILHLCLHSLQTFLVLLLSSTRRKSLLQNFLLLQTSLVNFPFTKWHYFLLWSWSNRWNLGLVSLSGWLIFGKTSLLRSPPYCGEKKSRF